MTETSGTILIVDHDVAVRQSLCATLQSAGFCMHEAGNGEEAIDLMRSRRFDALLLDAHTPGMGGLGTCSEARRLAPYISILVLTVRYSQDELVAALEAGADDYFMKPLQARELTARLRASVRRVRAGRETPEEAITVGAIQLNPGRRTVRKRGQVVRLTPKEFDLLHCLMSQPGTPVTHHRLLRTVWGPAYGNELEYLRTFVRQLRRKIEDDPAEPAYLLTDPYIGYRFATPAPAPRGEAPAITASLAEAPVELS